MCHQCFDASGKLVALQMSLLVGGSSEWTISAFPAKARSWLPAALLIAAFVLALLPTREKVRGIMPSRLPAARTPVLAWEITSQFALACAPRGGAHRVKPDTCSCHLRGCSTDLLLLNLDFVGVRQPPSIPRRHL